MQKTYNYSYMYIYITPPKVPCLLSKLYPKTSLNSRRRMYSQHQNPVQSTTPPLRRHHSARYYVHRVQESLTTRVAKLVCAIFLSLFLIIGVTIFILSLSLRPHRPRFHIREFSIPGLGQENGFENAQVVFNVTVRNSNQNIGIYYDATQATVYYEDQSIGGTTLLFPFYQEPKNTTVLHDVLSGAALTVNSDRWMHFLADRAKGTVKFRLEITSTIRFKVSTWDSKHHKMHANCEIGVGPDGLILPIYKDQRCPTYFN
ncbi:NDR1/HIN1-like protein 10 [Cornus florida]|uniref:NDR1/HIN1-like protein 10 n=1 Tax=Cornus florida TaxID=4283 RepID=UPI002899FF4A|nr:NDR1/HIN1-like protein 10 [Cornus florida]